MFIATIQIVIIFYIFIFYNSMVRTNLDDLASLSSNSLSGEMVAFVLLTLCIMVLDRVLYSTHQFQSRKNKESQEEQTKQDDPNQSQKKAQMSN